MACKCLPNYLTFVRGIRRWIMTFLRKGPVVQIFAVFVFDNKNNLLYRHWKLQVIWYAPTPVRRYCQGNKGSKIPRFPAYHVSLLLLDCCRGLRLRYSYGGHEKIAKPLYCGETRFTQRKIASWLYCTIAFDINVELIHYVTRYNTSEFVWINGHPMPSFYCILWGLIQIYSV